MAGACACSPSAPPRVRRRAAALFFCVFFLFGVGSHSCGVIGPGEHRRSTKPNISMYTPHSREPLEIDTNNMHGVFFMEETERSRWELEHAKY